MKYGDYYVGSTVDTGIERDNPETGKPEICKGYFCQVYRDREYQHQVDSFCLAVGHEIPDLSDASLAAGICEYLGLSHSDDYLHQIETALGATNDALNSVDEAVDRGVKIPSHVINGLVSVNLTLKQLLQSAIREHERSIQKTEKTAVLFSDLMPQPFAKDLDAHFAERGWQLQVWRTGNTAGYQVFFGKGVQVDNLFEYGFSYLYDKDELTRFAETFYKSHLKGGDLCVNMDTLGLAVAGHIGTWHTIDHIEVDGHTFWLMEHDTYGDDAACIIVDDAGKLLLEDVFNGFDKDTVDFLRQEVASEDLQSHKAPLAEQIDSAAARSGSLISSVSSPTKESGFQLE